MAEITETRHVYTLLFGLLHKAEVLMGHVSEETGYLVDDYPYGRKVRCRIRYWVETAAKGGVKGQMRPVSQTEEPTSKRWNKPRLGIYRDLVVLVKRADNGHVENFGLDRYAGPEYYMIFEGSGAAAGLTQEVPFGVYKLCVRSSLRQNAAAWLQYARMLPVAVQAIDACAGDTDAAYGRVHDWFDEVGDTRFGGKVSARPFAYRPKFDLFALAYAADVRMVALTALLRFATKAGTTDEEIPASCPPSAS